MHRHQGHHGPSPGALRHRVCTEHARDLPPPSASPVRSGQTADYNPFDPSLPTNSPNAHYAITDAALDVVRCYGTERWDSAVEKFRREQGTLVERYERERDYNMVPIKLPDGQKLQFSPGKYNEVQKAIIEEFAPRFAPGAHLLYLGDTAKKNLFVDNAGLAELGIPITDHDKLPDVVLYDAKRNWLFLIEAVTSHGPVTPKRILEIDDMLAASGTARSQSAMADPIRL
jgi:type II restriction enzyme